MSRLKEPIMGMLQSHRNSYISDSEAADWLIDAFRWSMTIHPFSLGLGLGLGLIPSLIFLYFSN